MSNFFSLRSVLKSDALRLIPGNKSFSVCSLRLNHVYCSLKFSLTALEYPIEYPFWYSTLVSFSLWTNVHNTRDYIEIITFCTTFNEFLSKLLWRWIYPLDKLTLDVCFIWWILSSLIYELYWGRRTYIILFIWCCHETLLQYFSILFMTGSRINVADVLL